TADSNAPAGGGALTVNGTAASGGGDRKSDVEGNIAIGSRSGYTETQSATESGLASSTLVRTSAGYSSANVCGSFGSPTTIGRTEERRVGKECRSRWTPTHKKNNGNTNSDQTTDNNDTADPTINLS